MTIGANASFVIVDFAAEVLYIRVNSHIRSRLLVVSADVTHWSPSLPSGNMLVVPQDLKELVS